MRLRLGTRGSALALAQSGATARALEALHPGLSVELVPIVTRGDRHLGDLAEVGGKGLFTAELEDGLVDGRFDLAVHSLKDLPVSLRPELGIAAFPRREDPRDVLIAAGAPNLAELAPGAVVLTGSLRRGAQIRHLRADLVVRPIRGNVDTRLRKWREGEGDAVVLAAAGLLRLGLVDREADQGTGALPVHFLSPDREMVPAPGQGILALEVKRGSVAEAICAALNDEAAARAAQAERRVVTAFGGDCTLPLAAWGRDEQDGRFRLSALLAAPDGRTLARADAEGNAPDAVAEMAIEGLWRDGAEAVLAELRRG